MGVIKSESGLDTVRRFYSLMGENKFEEGSQLLAEDVVIHESTDLPIGGDYHGRQGNAELIGRMTSVLDLEITKIDFLDATDPVVVKIRARFTSKTTGVGVDMDIIELITVRSGQIKEIDVYHKTPSKVAALWPK